MSHGDRKPTLLDPARRRFLEPKWLECRGWGIEPRKVSFVSRRDCAPRQRASARRAGAAGLPHRLVLARCVMLRPVCLLMQTCWRFKELGMTAPSGTRLHFAPSGVDQSHLPLCAHLGVAEGVAPSQARSWHQAPPVPIACADIPTSPTATVRRPPQARGLGGATCSRVSDACSGVLFV